MNEIIDAAIKLQGGGVVLVLICILFGAGYALKVMFGAYQTIAERAIAVIASTEVAIRALTTSVDVNRSVSEANKNAIEGMTRAFDSLAANLRREDR